MLPVSTAFRTLSCLPIPSLFKNLICCSSICIFIWKGAEKWVSNPNPIHLDQTRVMLYTSAAEVKAFDHEWRQRCTVSWCGITFFSVQKWTKFLVIMYLKSDINIGWLCCNFCWRLMDADRVKMANLLIQLYLLSPLGKNRDGTGQCWSRSSNKGEILPQNSF